MAEEEEQSSVRDVYKAVTSALREKGFLDQIEGRTRKEVLQVLKEVITHHNDDQHENRSVFEKVFEKIDSEGKLKHELVEQYKEVLEEEIPNTDSLGSHFGGNIKKSWTHFNLREQSELLQLIMLYLHQTGTDLQRGFFEDVGGLYKGSIIEWEGCH